MSSKRSLKKKHSSKRQIRITKSTDNIALAEVTKKLRDAMGAEDDDDSSGIFAVYDEVPAGHWAKGGDSASQRTAQEMGGDVLEEETRDESTVRRSSRMIEHFGIPCDQ